MHSKTASVSISLATSIEPSFSTQNTSIFSPSIVLSTQTDETIRATAETPRTVIKASQTLTEKPRTAKENETRSTIILPASTKQTPDKTLPKTMSPKPATFSLTTSLGKQSKSVEMPITRPEKPTKTVTEKNKEKVFWWNVTTGTSKYKVYLKLPKGSFCNKSSELLFILPQFVVKQFRTPSNKPVVFPVKISPASGV